MMNIKKYSFGILILLLVSGCTNNPPDYIKDGEAIMYAKDAGNDKIYIAIELFKKELEIHPNSTQAQIDLATAYGNLGQREYAIQILSNSIIKRQKDLAEFYHVRGIYKFIKNNYGESIEDFRKALEIDSTNHNLYKDIIFSKLWQQYRKEGKWLKFEKKDIASLIKEVYPSNDKVPTVEEFITTN